MKTKKRSRGSGKGNIFEFLQILIKILSIKFKKFSWNSLMKSNMGFEKTEKNWCFEKQNSRRETIIMHIQSLNKLKPIKHQYGIYQSIY